MPEKISTYKLLCKNCTALQESAPKTLCFSVVEFSVTLCHTCTVDDSGGFLWQELNVHSFLSCGFSVLRIPLTHLLFFIVVG